MSEESVKTEKKGKHPTKLLLVLFVVITLLGTSVYFFYQYQTLKNQVDGSSLAAQKREKEEAKKYVEEISHFMLLPNELPTIATVSDISKLKKQPFFAKAQNGDKLLLFKKAKLALLYNPLSKKIVNVGPITTDSTGNKPTPVKIMLLNGTAVAGLATKAESSLKKSFPGIDIKQKGTAKATYEKTKIVVLNEKAKATGEAIARFYHASLIDLPSQEVKPVGIDIVILLGRDSSQGEEGIASSSAAITQ